jgi:predicted transcriptional regulator
LPLWLPGKAWERFKSDQLIIACDTANLRRETSALAEHAPPIVRAALASLSPVWEDATGLAAGARLDEQLAVHAWAATKGPESSARVERTTEALRTLAQSVVRNTRSTLQAGNQPDRELMVSLLDVLDELLEHAKLHQQGNELLLATSAAMDKAMVGRLGADLAAAYRKAGGRYRAAAMLGVAMLAKPDLSSAEAIQAARDRFTIFGATQAQLVVSRFVLQAALRDPKLARLPSIRHAAAKGDAVVWLQHQLQVSFPNKAELMEVSFSSDDPKEAAAVVNAVVDTYLKEVMGSERDRKLARSREGDRELLKIATKLQVKRAELQKLTEGGAKSTPEIEKLRAEIKELDAAVAKATQEREKLRSALRSSPRVVLLIPAAVPQLPNR